MIDEPDHPSASMRAAVEQLTATNVVMAEWAASALENSPSLVERLELMGYDVRGKSHGAVVEVLKHPPTRAPTHVEDC